MHADKMDISPKTGTASNVPKVSVAIVGAGLSGLCLAQALLRAGMEVQVYERDQAVDARRQGYRITVDEHGIAAIKRCLPPRLFELFLATTSPTDHDSYFRLTNGKLREIFKLTFKGDPTGTDLRIPRQADRQTLRTIMLEGLQERVHFGKRVVHSESNPDGAVLHFNDGTSAHAAFIVCADGVHSSLRKQYLPDCEPEDVNHWAIYGRTRLVHEKDKPLMPEGLKTSGIHAIGRSGDGIFFTTMAFREAPQAAFSRMGIVQPPPMVDDYIMWAVLMPKERFSEYQTTSDPDLLFRVAQNVSRDFHPAIRRLIEHADVDYTMGVKFKAGRKPSRWPSSRVIFMGDAVHVMPPTGSHGGNTALRDAGLLADKLEAAMKQEADFETAIYNYYHEMSKYAFHEVEASKSMMKRFTMKNPVMRWTMLSAIPWIRSLTNQSLTID